jgi:hypothetical protein
MRSNTEHVIDSLHTFDTMPTRYGGAPTTSLDSPAALYLQHEQDGTTYLEHMFDIGA